MFIKVGLFSYTGIAVLQALGEKKLHIGATSDPTHQVRLNFINWFICFRKKSNHSFKDFENSSKFYLDYWLTDWLTTNWLTDRLTADWLTDGLTTDWLTDWLTDQLCNRLAGLLTDWLTDRSTDWLNWLNRIHRMNGFIKWLIDWRTDWLID